MHNSTIYVHTEQLIVRICTSFVNRIKANQVYSAILFYSLNLHSTKHQSAPMATSNHITKVALVGVRKTTPSTPPPAAYQLTKKPQAGGNSGSVMTDALLKTGKHTITALTRVDSQIKLPESVICKRIDYGKPETLVEALRGQDALVITLSGHTPKEIEMQLVDAAGEAGVPWILPNEWSPDTANEALVKDVFVFQPKGKRSLIVHAKV